MIWTIPGKVRNYTYQLINGPGGEDNNKYLVSGDRLLAAQSFTTEGNHSIQARVTDDEGESLDKNLTINVVDPTWDGDGDGLGIEQELIAGTNPDNPDTDGDGANDGAEVTAGTDPLDSSVYPNRSPRDLNSTTALTILENQPAGTTVGEFNATDPDGDAVTYHFVTGENNNSLFTLDTNGTLKAATTFDYESNASSYTIRVQAKDDQNATVEDNFIVSLIDYNEGEVPAVGDGTTANPYQIATLGHLRWLSITPSVWNAEFLQVADINASTTKEWEGGAGFSPIGDSGSQFTGVFNGGGYLIYNLFIDRPATSTIGMFGRVTGKITDLSLIDLNVTGKSTVGGLVAFPQGEITRCYVSGWVNGSGQSIGGLAGNLSNSGVVEQCVAQVEVNAGSSSANIGGIIGFIRGVVKNSYSTGQVTGNNSSGGFVGYSIGGTILNSYSTGKVTSQYNGSGFVKLDSSSSATGCFWDTTTSEWTSTSGGGTGKTTANMKILATFTNAGWDFNNIWEMPENDYPFLKWQIRNSPPADFNATALLSIAENQLVGMVVGEFNATDPDGDAITYHFVSGDNNNSLFTLDTNGTIKTATTFDYESNASSYTITVQAKDELNATTEGNFTVTLLDAYEDTDGDGFRDSFEVSIGSNLSDANSTPLGYGFIAWYPFDGNFSDISGNGNDATNYDSNFTKDRFGVAGKALFFDGVDDRVKLPHTTLNGSTEFTYNLWYKMEDRADSYGAFLSGANDQKDNEILLQINSHLKFDIWDNLNQLKGDYQRGVEWENIWRMLTFVRTNQQIQIYLEDQLFETFEYSHDALSIDEGGLWIGPDQDSVGGGWDATQHLYGVVDEVKVYKRPLTSSEVSFLYSKDSASIVDLSLPKRVIDWNQTFSGLNETSGAIVLDANASGHNSEWVNLVAPENAVTGFPSSGFHASHPLPGWLQMEFLKPNI